MSTTNAMKLTTADMEWLAESVADKLAAKMLDQPKLVGRHQIAVITSTSLSTIDRLTRTGEIPSVRSGTRVLYDPEEVIQAMKKCKRCHESLQT